MGDEKKTTKVIIAAIIAILVVIMAGAMAIYFVLQMGDFSDSGDGDRLSVAKEYLDSGDYESAISEYLVVLDEDNTNVEAYEGITTSYVELEEYDEAIKILEEALVYLEDEDDIEEITDLLNQVREMKPNSDNGDSDPDKVNPDPDYDNPPVDPVEPNDEAVSQDVNHDKLMEYYNNLVSKSSSLSFKQAFEEECGYTREYGEIPSHMSVFSRMDGYVNCIFYDFDLDGIDELVATHYDSYDEFSIKVFDIDNNYPMEIFSLSGIRASLCGTNNELTNDVATVELGLCTKNGKVYITERSTYVSEILTKYFRREMHIYEVNGSSADHVFYEWVGGADENAMRNNGPMMNAYAGFPGKLIDIGFDETARELSTDLYFSNKEDITPLVYGCSRHCGIYERFDSRNASNNPGKKAFVFSETAAEGEKIMNDAHPYR